jgi:hypothetical protein
LPLVATWIVTFASVFAFLWPLAMLYDTDSYYHLAIARAYLHHGLLHDLPWARFSVMHHGFGDKELLFHVLLLPAAAASDPVFGAKLTLAALDATILTSMAQLSRRAVGSIGTALPALALFGSASFDLRLLRLRPELLALLLLLWTLHALSTRRAWMAGVCAFAFALAYTAIHALLGICGLCFAVRLWLDRKPSYRELLLPIAGAVCGLWLHPHFPHNLRIFYLQNLEFWRYQHTADVGNEILPLGLARWLSLDWPLLAGSLLLLCTLRPGKSLARATRDEAAVYCAGALPFVLLFVHSARFAIYAVPLGLLAGAWSVRLLGFRLDARMSLRGHEGPRCWLALLLLLLVGSPLTAAALGHEVAMSGCVWPALRDGLKALGRALPDGAKVAAPWDSSEDYVYFAPQARYLNLLDPLFMRSAHPKEYEVQRELFLGRRPDAPLSVLAHLDSDFLAFPGRRHAALAEQLAGDPRAELLVAQGQLLYRMRPERARAFVRDFRVAATHAQLAQPTAARYPRHPTALGREIEAVIDIGRLGGTQLAAARCIWLAPEASVEHADVEVASTAPARLWVDGELQKTIPRSERLLPGSGSIVAQIPLAQLTIELCPQRAAAAQLYLLRREPRLMERAGGVPATHPDTPPLRATRLPPFP